MSQKDILSCEDLPILPLVDGTALHTDPIAFVSTASPRSYLVKLHSTGTATYGSKIVYWHPRVLMSTIAYGERDRRILRRLLGRSHNLVRLSFFHPDSSTSDTSRFRASRLFVPRAVMETHWAPCELPYEEIVQLLEKLRPDVVYSYGSFAESFLLHIADKHIETHLPKVWVFGGDGVTAEGRQLIETDLGCRLYSTYQAIECGRIGFECELGCGYHINTDFCHVRLVDGRGETVEPGEIGEVVISCLSNLGSILLNYRLGDYAKWSIEPCACGRSLPLLHLTGARTTSSLRLLDGTELQEHALLHACKNSIHDVLQAQIVEHGPESIVWRVVLASDANYEQVAANLRKGSRSVMSAEADIKVEAVDRIILPPGSKLTRIVRATDGGSTQQ
jgi:phenylacetate-CoA ligase